MSQLDFVIHLFENQSNSNINYNDGFKMKVFYISFTGYGSYLCGTVSGWSLGMF